MVLIGMKITIIAKNADRDSRQMEEGAGRQTTESTWCSDFRLFGTPLSANSTNVFPEDVFN